MAGANVEDDTRHNPKNLLKELWRSGVWLLFPVLFIYITSVAVLVPVTPTIITNFFAERYTHASIRCEDFSVADSPQACVDAHSDAANWQAWSSFVSQSVLSFLLAPMIGSWSDEYGRKPFLLAGFISAALPVTVIMLHITLGFPLYFYFAASALNGSISSLSVCLAYVADLLRPSHRASCFGLILASFSLGILLGPFIGRFLTPAVASFVALGGVGLSILYTAFILPESLVLSSRQEAKEHHVSASQTVLKRWQAMKILLRSTLFKRLTVCIMITGIVAEGLQDLLIQYLQLKLAFGPKDQSTLFMVYGILGLFVQMLILPVLLRFCSETRVLVIGMCASLTQQVALAFVPNKALAFACVALGTMGSVAFPAISSIKANNVLDSEQGSVQGALYGARSLAQGIGPLIFAQIFAAFSRVESPLPYFPGATFLFGAVLMCVAIGIAISIDGASGRALMAEHKELNPQLNGQAYRDVAESEYDEESLYGETPTVAATAAEVHPSSAVFEPISEKSSLLSRNSSSTSHARRSMQRKLSTTSSHHSEGSAAHDGTHKGRNSTSRVGSLRASEPPARSGSPRLARAGSPKP